jgi:hypothetical protein
MTWRLFIDDERDPPNDGNEWKVARHYRDVKLLLFSFGPPVFISFDHDLGEKMKTGYEIAKKLVEWDMDGGPFKFRDDFDYYVHSQNPVGKANIEAYLNNYLEMKRAQKL